jgi:hypothetical protein
MTLQNCSVSMLYTHTNRCDPVEFHQTCPHWGAYIFLRRHHKIYRDQPSLHGPLIREPTQLSGKPHALCPNETWGHPRSSCLRVCDCSQNKGKGSKMVNCKMQTKEGFWAEGSEQATHLFLGMYSQGCLAYVSLDISQELWLGYPLLGVAVEGRSSPTLLASSTA